MFSTRCGAIPGRKAPTSDRMRQKLTTRTPSTSNHTGIEKGNRALPRKARISEPSHETLPHSDLSPEPRRLFENISRTRSRCQDSIPQMLEIPDLCPEPDAVGLRAQADAASDRRRSGVDSGVRSALRFAKAVEAGKRMLIGIDWGGTKIEGVAMEPDGTELSRVREATPRHDYFGCIAVIKDVIDRMERQVGRRGSIGIGIPGSLEPRSRLGKGASSTWLLGRPVEKDLIEALHREIRVENDADCFAASEAHDGAGVRSQRRLRRHPGIGRGSWHCGQRLRSSRPEQQRGGMGSQSASDPRRDRNSRRALLLRQARMHGDLGLRPRVRSGIRAPHGNEDARQRDHRFEAKGRSPFESPLATLRQSRRARPGDRGEHAGPGRFRDGRRDVEHRGTLRRPAGRACRSTRSRPFSTRRSRRLSTETRAECEARPGSGNRSTHSKARACQWTSPRSPRAMRWPCN